MLGCDIIEIERIESSIDKFGDKFLRKVLTPKELDLYHTKGSKGEFVAGRFAAKEAVSKALRTGIDGTLSLTDIEILPGENGAPELYLYDKKRTDINISISHSRHNAIAVCVVSGV